MIQTPRRQLEIEDSIIQIFEYWNTLGIVKHRVLTAKNKRYIKMALTAYSINEIKNAILNYAKILHDDQSWFTVKYNLSDFLADKMDRFLDENKPMETFYYKTNQSGVARVAGGSTPPDSPAIPPDYKEKFIQWKKDKK